MPGAPQTSQRGLLSTVRHTSPGVQIVTWEFLKITDISLTFRS